MCLVVIVANALWIGLELDLTDAAFFASEPDATEPPVSFTIIDQFFCAFFSMEIVVRVLAYRRYLDFFCDKSKRLWNLFDLALVLLLIMETWVLKASSANVKLPALSSLRLLRMLRMIRVLRMVPELAMMVRSLVAALRSVSMTFVLAVGVIYVFSILFTQWARDHEQVHPCPSDKLAQADCIEFLFGTIGRSFLTLMQLLCFDNCFAVIRATIDESKIYGLLLIVFILIAAFTILNMLIGVVCQIVASTSSDEGSKIVKAQVAALFRQLDHEGNGFISRKAIDFHQQSLISKLEKYGVEEEVLKTALQLLDRKSLADLPAAQIGFIDVSELLGLIFKLLHPPETQDVILIQRKLEKLEKALNGSASVSGLQSRSVMAAAVSQSIDAANTAEANSTPPLEDPMMIEGHAVERSLATLESQVSAVSAMLEHALKDAVVTKTVGTGTTAMLAAKAPAAGIVSGGGCDTELRRLDVALTRLRMRLERCCQETSAVDGAVIGATGQQAVSAQMVSAEVNGWRRLCAEVVQSISAASMLLAQAVREVEPEAGAHIEAA